MCLQCCPAHDDTWEHWSRRLHKPSQPKVPHDNQFCLRQMLVGGMGHHTAATRQPLACTSLQCTARATNTHLCSAHTAAHRQKCDLIHLYSCSGGSNRSPAAYRLRPQTSSTTVCASTIGADGIARTRTVEHTRCDTLYMCDLAHACKLYKGRRYER